MALPADFNKIYGSTATGGLTPISDVNYAKGWEFVGSNPPTKNDFSYLQNLSDKKSQWLYSNKLQRADPFGDIKSDGSVAVSTALSNLGLGNGSALPVGVPVPWPSAVPPAGWMKCNGSTFNLASYPALAAVFPSGVLPDLRGEFIRGWDDGRGVDTGRGILSAQGDAIRNIVGSISGLAVLETGTGKGAIKITASSNTSRWEGVTSGRGLIRDLDFDSSGTSGVNVAEEVRPRNIAFNYIVRAV